MNKKRGVLILLFVLCILFISLKHSGLPTGMVILDDSKIIEAENIFSDSWTLVDGNYSNGKALFTDSRDTFVYKFNGTSIKLLTTRNNNLGRIEFILDKNISKKINLYSEELESTNILLFNNLSNQEHKIEFKIINSSNSEENMLIDAFLISDDIPEMNSITKGEDSTIQDASSKLLLDILYPTNNIEVIKDEWFNVTVNVTCKDANCGNINVSLDPEVGKIWDDIYDAGNNEEANGVTIDSTGNVYVIGYVTNTDDDYYIIKYDSNGNIIQNITYDSGNNDYGYRITVDSLGYIYATGESNGNWVTIKYNPDGTKNWLANYTSVDYIYPYDIEIDNNRFVYVTGNNNEDYLAIKYNPDGTENLSVNYNSENDDESRSIAVDNLGFFYVTGSSNDGVTYNYYTIKYNSDGTENLTLEFDSDGDDEAYGIDVDSLGNIYVAGTIDDSTYYTIKYDSNGNELWNASYSSDGDNYVYDLDVDSYGNSYVTGYEYNDTDGFYYIKTIKYDTDGNEVWSDAFLHSGEDEEGYGIVADDNGYVYVTGDHDNGNDADFITVKYFTNSEVQTKSGLISTVIGDKPFYTNESNPRTISLNENESQIVNFWVNATAHEDITSEFFVFANLTAFPTVGNISDKWNVTVHATPPNIVVHSPIDYRYTTNQILINFSATDTDGISNLWYFNETDYVPYTSPHYVNISQGDHTFVFYANDTNGLINYTEVNFSFSNARILLDLIYPTDDITVLKYQWFNVTANLTCINSNCGNISVTLDPYTYSPITPDIESLTWTTTSLGDDDSVVVDLQYNYTFNGTKFNKICISSNGYVVLTNSANYYCDDIFDISIDDLPDNSIAPFSFDMNPTDGSGSGYIRYYRDANSFIVYYDSVYEYGTTNPYSAQIKLNMNSDPEIHYGTISGTGAIAGISVISGVDNTEITEASNSAFSFSDQNTHPKGIVSTNSSTTPYYTNSTTNPLTINLNENESQIITFWVNANATKDITSEFFVYTNLTNSPEINNISTKRNVSVLTSQPDIIIYSPYPYPYIYDTKTILVNFSAADSINVSSMWYYNETEIVPFISPHYVNVSHGNHTFTFYANNTLGLISSEQRTFQYDESKLNIDIISNVDNISLKHLESFDISVNVTCQVQDCNNINVTALSDGSIINAHSGSPFFINDSNSMIISLNKNESKILHYKVTETANSDFVSHIYIIANKTSNPSNYDYTNTFNVTVTAKGPDIIVNSPQNKGYNSPTSPQSILIDFNATDIDGISAMWINNGTDNITYTNSYFQNFSNGIYNYTFYVNDTLGNINWESIVFEVYTIDIDIDVISPLSNVETFKNKLVNVTFNISCLADDCGTLDLTLNRQISNIPFMNGGFEDGTMNGWTLGVYYADDNQNNWSIQSSVVSDGNYAAKSGSCDGWCQTYMSQTIYLEEQTYMLFKWRVLNGDYLCYTVDNPNYPCDGCEYSAQRIYNQNYWTTKSVTLPPGSHTVSWCYTHDDYYGTPAGYVDNVYIDEQNLIDTSIYAQPMFIKNSANPTQIALNSSQSQLVTYTLNYTGDVGYSNHLYLNVTKASNSDISFRVNTSTISIIETSIYVELPLLNSVFNGGNVEFAVSSNQNISSCKFSIDSWLTNYTMQYVNQTYYNYSLNLTPLGLTNGIYTAQFWCNSTINVESTTNRTFAYDSSKPIISFINSTPDDNATLYTKNVSIYLNITENNLYDVLLNWNNINLNYSYGSLLLMMNFDNISSLGESTTSFKDASKYSRHSIPNGKTLAYIDGKYNSALRFRYTSRYITTPDIELPESYTVEFWMKDKFTSIVNQFSLIKNSESQNSHIFFEGDSIGIKKDGSIYLVNSINVDDWTHIVATSENNITRFYVNGNYIGYAPAVVTTSINRIGDGDGESGVAGILDELKIYDRALSTLEIKQKFNSNLNKKSTSNWNYVYSFMDISHGTYSYFGKAIDSSDGINQTETRTINFDLPPDLTILSPNTSYVDISNIDLNVSGNKQLNNCKLSLDWWITNYTMSQYNSTVFSYTLTNLNDNYHTANIICFDTSGNNAIIQFDFVVDTKVPLIEYTEPTPDNNSILNYNSTIIAVNISEIGINELKYNWNNVNYSIYDDDLILMLNFDNNTNLGETGTTIIDSSTYKNNGYSYKSPSWDCTNALHKCAVIFNAHHTIIPFGGQYITVPLKNKDQFNNWTIEWWQYTEEDTYWPGFVPYSLFDTGHFYYDSSFVSIYSTRGIGNFDYGQIMYKWAHFALVENEIEGKLYINGKLEKTYSGGTGGIIKPNTELIIGNNKKLNGHFTGKLDSFSIYKRAFSEDEVKALYSSNLIQNDLDNWTLSINKQGLANGNYSYYINIKDNLNRTNQTKEREIVFDLVPDLSLISPLRFTNNQNINFTITSDSELDYCKFSTDNWVSEHVMDRLNGSSFTYSKTMEDGNYIAKFICNSSTGVVNNVYEKTFVIDTTPPLINYGTATPQDNSVYSINPVSIDFNIEETNLNNLIWNWDGTNYSFYDDNLILMTNFDKVNPLGESLFKPIDLSQYNKEFSCSAASCPDWTSNGKYSGAYSFNGSDNFDTDIILTEDYTTNYTFMMWAYVNCSSSQTGYLFKTTNIGSSERLYGIFTRNNQWLDGFEEGGDWDYEDTGFAVDCDKWQHIAAVYQRHPPTTGISSNPFGKVYFYKNNIQSTYNGYLFGVSIAPHMLSIGNNFKGLIDEVRIFNRSLSQDEISQFYYSNLKKQSNNNWLFSTDEPVSDLTNYSFQAYTTDVADYSDQTQERSIFIDLPPELTIHTPITKQIYSNSTLLFNLSSNKELDYCKISLDNGLNNYSLNSYNSTSWYLEISDLIDGQNIAKLWCNSTYGTMNSDKQVMYYIDTRYPNLEYVPPTVANNGKIYGKTTIINTTITEPSLNSLILTWNNSNYSVYDDSLVLSYNFDNIDILGESLDNFYDNSLIENDANCTFCPNLTENGKHSGGLYFELFDGQIYSLIRRMGTDYPENVAYKKMITSKNNISIVGNQSRTISVWIRGEDLTKSGTSSDANYPVIWWGEKTTNKMTLISINNRKLTYYAWGNTLTGSTTLNSDTWYHIAATYNGSNLTLYLNGEYETSAIKSLDTTDSEINIGAFNIVGSDMFGYAEWTNYFYGDIDEIRIWNRSLTSDEIAKHYEINLNKYSGVDWRLTYTPTNVYRGNYTHQIFSKDLFERENATESRTISFLVNPIYYNFSSYNGTTNFSLISDFSNVTNLSLATQYGQIQFPEDYGINTEYENYDVNVLIAQGFVSVNSSALNQTFNSTSTITLNNIVCPSNLYYGSSTYESRLDIVDLKNICNQSSIPSCTDMECSNDTISFTASGFSGYAASAFAELQIWDDSDEMTVFVDTPLFYYANYTNLANESILNATCTININGSNDIMNYNNITNLYQYNSVMSNMGTFNWSVSCGNEGFDQVNTNDTFAISGTYLTLEDSSDTSFKYLNDTITFYANYSNDNYEPINGSCRIKFYQTSYSEEYNDMILNDTISLYSFQATFNTSGVFTWNVDCNSTTFAPNSKNSSLIISEKIVNVTPEIEMFESVSITAYNANEYCSFEITTPDNNTETQSVTPINGTCQINFINTYEIGIYEISTTTGNGVIFPNASFEVLAAYPIFSITLNASNPLPNEEVNVFGTAKNNIGLELPDWNISLSIDDSYLSYNRTTDLLVNYSTNETPITNSIGEYNYDFIAPTDYRVYTIKANTTTNNRIGYNTSYLIVRSPVSQPPNITTHEFIPSLLNTISDINCSTTVTDDYHESMLVFFKWYQNNQPRSEYGSNTICDNDTICYATQKIPLSEIHEDDNWTCSVQAYDGSNYTDWINTTGTIIEIKPLITLDIDPEIPNSGGNISIFGNVKSNTGINISNHLINIYIDNIKYYYNDSTNLLVDYQTPISPTTDSYGNYNYTISLSNINKAYSVLINATYVLSNYNSTIFIVNTSPSTQPSVSSVQIAPSINVNKKDNLNCSGIANDNEHISMIGEFKWLKNGIEQNNNQEICQNSQTCYNSIIFSNESFVKNDEIICSFRAFDGSNYSNWVNSTILEIENTLQTLIPIPELKWLQNTNYTLDLSNHFIDPDNEQLNYSNFYVENVNFEYINDTVIIIPDADMTFDRTTLFTSIDNEYNEVSSNPVSLRVVECLTHSDCDDGIENNVDYCLSSGFCNHDNEPPTYLGGLEDEAVMPGELWTKDISEYFSDRENNDNLIINCTANNSNIDLKFNTTTNELSYIFYANNQSEGYLYNETVNFDEINTSKIRVYINRTLDRYVLINEFEVFNATDNIAFNDNSSYYPKARASSLFHNSSLEYLNDGNTSTVFWTDSGAFNYFEIDFESSKLISGIKFIQPKQLILDYTLEYWNENAWIKVHQNNHLLYNTSGISDIQCIAIDPVNNALNVTSNLFSIRNGECEYTNDCKTYNDPLAIVDCYKNICEFRDTTTPKIDSLPIISLENMSISNPTYHGENMNISVTAKNLLDYMPSSYRINVYNNNITKPPISTLELFDDKEINPTYFDSFDKQSSISYWTNYSADMTIYDGKLRQNDFGNQKISFLKNTSSNKIIIKSRMKFDSR